MKRIIYILFIILSIAIIASLINSIYALWHKKDLLVQAQNQLAEEKKRHNELEKRLSVVKSPLFVEEEARNKLFLVKPGESELLIPSDSLPKTQQGVKSTKQDKPNWQQWLDLF